MVAPRELQDALGRIRDQGTFLCEFLAGLLHWPLAEGVKRIEDIGYKWSADELQADGLDADIVDGQTYQFQPFRTDQPWGIFLLEFKHPDALTSGRGMTGPLRKVLRGLVPKRRASANHGDQRKWRQENLLFISTHDYRDFRFSYFKAPLDPQLSAPLATFGWNEGDTHIRTLCEHNLPALEFPQDSGRDALQWLDSWRSAFDIEAVTKRFFVEYHEVFEGVERALRGPQGAEVRRLYTQRLSNRLMFAYFVQRKGWLEFEGRKDYLRALYERALAGKEDFLNDRLHYAFFAGFNTGDERVPKREEKELRAVRGRIPFLNGGLFEMADDCDVRGKVELSNAHFGKILDLCERYNFTVSESTPLDIEVAVDPEMLGKVFEELVTGRHESGSYYTPRPVVAFMCREALKGYLGRFEKDAGAIEALVDRDDSSKLQNPEGILAALREVKVCDPACGSGAYLLGMMQELLRLRAALFKFDAKLDTKSVYERKLEIIEHNLYGVDLDPFAVNIAMLRLWLSLIVEYDGDTPEPLPNLDFKIACGDSLTASDPMGSGEDNMFVQRRDELADGIAVLKGQFMNTHDNVGKQLLRQKIAQAELELREFAQSEKLPPTAFDWRVRFCEVFAPRGGTEATLDGQFGFIAAMKPQREFTLKLGREQGGFDIVVANPPYIRKEKIDARAKPLLRQEYGSVLSGQSDLYCYFYVRGLQLLREGGMHVFVCSNSWLDSGYGFTLQKYILSCAHVKAIYDSAVERQFATADVNTIISVFRKTKPSTDNATVFVMFRAKFDDAIRNERKRTESRLTRAELWADGANGNNEYCGNKWGGKYLRAPDIYHQIRQKAKARLVRLSFVAEVQGYIHDNNTGEAFPKVPFLKSVRNTETILINQESPGVVSYGVKKDGNSRLVSPLLFPRTFGSRHLVVWNPEGVYGKEFYKVLPHVPKNAMIIAAQLNSTWGILQRELLGLVNLGEGAVKFSIDDVGLFEIVSGLNGDDIKPWFFKMARRPQADLRNELKQDDRRALDSVIFDAMGLCREEREAVYTAVESLVAGREEKANSVT
ncbi:MAG TPA: N-6 DNA methylase [Planctomycetota bacterium]|jgi:methylase of polypeptide subunit release factors